MSDTETYKGYTIRIEPDHDPMNPVEDWDHIATFVSKGRDYRSWEPMPEDEVEELYETDGEPTVEDYVRYFKEQLGARVVLAVRKFEHGSVNFRAVSLEDRHKAACRFDDMLYGFVYDTPEDVRKCWGDTVPTDEQIEAGLRGMVESYSAYANGEVVGYVIEHEDYPSGWCGDSCWGYYSDEDALAEARSQVDWHIGYIERENAKVARCMAL